MVLVILLKQMFCLSTLEKSAQSALFELVEERWHSNPTNIMGGCTCRACQMKWDMLQLVCCRNLYVSAVPVTLRFWVRVKGSSMLLRYEVKVVIKVFLLIKASFVWCILICVSSRKWISDLLLAKQMCKPLQYGATGVFVLM